MAGSDKHRQENQAAYVLHAYPFRETSLVVEIFSRDFGRLAVVARGARRPKSALRGLLLSFQPLQLSWFGKSELRTLHKAEWQGGLPLLQGMSLICGFYLNELLVKLLPRDDPHDKLFQYYEETLHALAQRDTAPDFAAILRRFETRLLRELGYALTLEQEADSGSAIEAADNYVFQIERGPLRGARAGQNGVQLLGKTLLDMAADDYTDPVTQQQSKTLMRTLINHYLGGEPLHTRQLLIDLQQL